MSEYKRSKDFSSRKTESLTICGFWPDKLPLILEKDKRSKMSNLPKPKILCPKEFSVLQFLVFMRKKMNLPHKSGFFVMVNGGEVLSGDKMMIDIYQRHCDRDGFLYLTYGEHEVYG